MIKTLKRIEPLQFGKISGVVYGLISLIFVPFILIFAVAGMFIPHSQGSGMPMAAMGLVGALVSAVVIPVLYGAMGFIFGVIGAWVYNIVAKWIGGIRVEVE